MRVCLLSLFLLSCSFVEPIKNDNQGPCITWKTSEQVIRTPMRFPADGYLEEKKLITYCSEYDNTA